MDIATGVLWIVFIGGSCIWATILFKKLTKQIKLNRVEMEIAIESTRSFARQRIGNLALDLSQLEKDTDRHFEKLADDTVRIKEVIEK